MVEKVEETEDTVTLLISFCLYLVLLLFQSLVLSHFLYKIYGRQLSAKIKYITLSVVLVAWVGLCFELTIILLNLSSTFAVQTGYCSFVIWFKYNLFIIFELILSIFWIIRIYHTFKYSVFEIQMKHALIICTIISTICIIFLIITSASIHTRYKEVNVSLSSEKQIHGLDCTSKWSVGGILTVYITGQIVTLFFNIFFAVLFFTKLNALQKINNEFGGSGNMRKVRLFQLTQKHTHLACVSAINSIICWLLFDSFALSLSNGIEQDMLVILSVDRVIKSLCIVLMYKFYEEIFSKICSCCLRITNSNCMCSKIRDMFPYFDAQRNTSIFHQSPVVVETVDLYGEDVSVNESVIKEFDAPRSPVPNRSLPRAPSNHLTPRFHIADSSRDLSVSKSTSYSKPLPQMDFKVNPYKMYNFIACLTEPHSNQMKLRYLDYSKTQHTIISTHIFNAIEEQSQSNKGVVIMDNFKSDKMFSFLLKSKTLYPYKLAIRLKDHEEHLEDALKLLKYAEYQLNEAFKKIKVNSFDCEPYFDKIATKIANDGGGINFIEFNSSGDGFAQYQKDSSRDISGGHSDHENTEHMRLHLNSPQRTPSVEDNYSNRSMPPITPPLRAVDNVHSVT